MNIFKRKSQFGDKNGHAYRQAGFSLIEILVYIVIMVILLAVIMQVIVSITRSQRLINAARAIESSTALSLERITREVRLSDNVNLSSSVLNSNPGTLVLQGLDSLGSPRTVEFTLSNGRIILRENSVETGTLTEDGTTVTGLVFRRFASSTIEGIQTEITIESGTSTHYRTETFYSSATIR